MDTLKAPHVGRKNQRRVEYLHRRGFIATLDHEKKLIEVEFTQVSKRVFTNASRLIEHFAQKGYENI